MIFNMVCGGGNGSLSSLNFEVVIGTTKPLNPRKNTLWVPTDLQFNSLSFDVSQPTNLQVNDIWIKLGTISPIKFDILDDDNASIFFCPIGVYQLVDSWVNLTSSSMFWDGVKWIDFETYLFKDGNQYINLTGGWQKRQDSGSWMDVGLSESTISVLYSAKRDYGINAYVRTKNLIDVTGYNELSIVLDEFSERFKLSLVDSNENEITSVSPTSTGTIAMSLANITGNYYINLYAYGNDYGTEGDSYATAKFTVQEVKLS